MAHVPAVVLKAKKARPFFGRHPWVFESAIEKVEGEPAAGAVVRLLSHDRELIAHGLINPHSKLRVRLYSWDHEVPSDWGLFERRLEQAAKLRRDAFGLGDPAGACRVCFSEGDGLSGLIIDRYADVFTVQFTSLAMHQHEAAVVDWLTRSFQPRAIIRRTERQIGEWEGLRIEDAVLSGDAPEWVEFREHGLTFAADPLTGQKTGAYLDQRDNRLAFTRYTAGRNVLDVCCHGGAFATHALALGKAASAVGIDTSGAAVALAQRNVDRNGVAGEFMHGEAAPSLQRLLSEGRRFGAIVVDPPKFARTHGDADAALRGYESLNRLAVMLLEPNGVLFTCSCSGHVTREMFLEMLAATAQKCQRELFLLETRGQAPDHPVSLFCLETSYLKCIVARVGD